MKYGFIFWLVGDGPLKCFFPLKLRVRLLKASGWRPY